MSGRGVGLDVVKQSIESIHGSILVSSSEGWGTTFTLILPLTMAIIDGMTVAVGRETYIVPILSIVESFRPLPSMISTVVNKAEMVSFRGRLLPLFRLSRVFGVDDGLEDPCECIAVVVDDAGKQVALLVDRLLGQRQSVQSNRIDVPDHQKDPHLEKR